MNLWSGKQYLCVCVCGGGGVFGSVESVFDLLLLWFSLLV